MAAAGVVALGVAVTAAVLTGGPDVSPVRAKLADYSFVVANTSGYVASQVNAVQVTGTFVVPTLSACQTGQTGDVNVFWVGIYGPDSGGVTAIAQDGFGITCTNGQPAYFPWMNTNAVDAQDDPFQDPVQAGDSITATVNALDGNGDYGMEVDDWTQGWCHTADISGGAVGDDSASISAESHSGGVFFYPVPVTYADLNGNPIGQYSPQAWQEDPSDYGGSAALDPTPLDVSGQDFTFAWDSPAVGPTAPVLLPGAVPRQSASEQGIPAIPGPSLATPSPAP